MTFHGDAIARLESLLAESHAERSADFARRVKVEQRLLDASSGKTPLPTPEECRELAHQLGIPDEFRDPPNNPPNGLLERARDALNGMIGLVQLVSDRRYPDFPVDNHRVIEAQSCVNALNSTLCT